MKASRMDVFGPGFVPGKVKGVRDAVSRAMGKRWSGLPAEDHSAETGRPPSRGFASADGMKG